MSTRYFALIFGIVYTLVALAGFIPGLLETPPADAPPLTLDTLYGYLMGIFPVNILHTLVHLVFGLWGIMAYRSFDAARTFSRVAAITFGLLAVLGLIPGLNTLFGMTPLHGNDIWLHGLSALAAAYFGWVAPADRPAAVAD